MPTMFRTASLTVAIMIAHGAASPAHAQSTDAVRLSCGDRPVLSVTELFTGTARDFRHLPTRRNAAWLTLGAGGSLAARPADNDVTRRLSTQASLHEPLEAGAVIGGTPVQLSAAMLTYAIGRMTSSPCAASVAGDLVRAQLMAEGLSIGIKRSVRRPRPEGSGFSFPSGHTTVSFASATVLQQHFGWKIGAPAYAAATYVAASRVQMKRHYLSDVAFGAALGIVSGRAVTFGHSRTVRLEPALTPGGAGASLTWVGR